MRSLASVWTILIIFLIGLTPSCQTPPKSVRGTAPAPVPSPVQDTPVETITVASWNLQVFGRSKASDERILNGMAHIISTFDFIAIQEIKDISGNAFQALMGAVKAKNPQFTFALSPRVGSGGAIEQYAFIFRKDRIAVIDAGTIYSGSEVNEFARPPLISHFRTVSGNFDFVAINVHTAPENANAEIRALASVVRFALNRYPDEKDVIVLGDLNADCSYFNARASSHEIKMAPFRWLITDGSDTNVSSKQCAYDRIVIGPATEEDYTGKASIWKFEVNTTAGHRQYSDHWPVSATFYTNRDTD